MPLACWATRKEADLLRRADSLLWSVANQTVNTYAGDLVIGNLMNTTSS